MSKQDVKYQMEPNITWLATRIHLARKFVFFPIGLVCSNLLLHLTFFLVEEHQNPLGNLGI
jgi:hypothetical protein